MREQPGINQPWTSGRFEECAAFEAASDPAAIGDRLSPPDGPGQLSGCVDRLVAQGYLARSSTSIHITSKGIEYGLSVAGRP